MPRPRVYDETRIHVGIRMPRAFASAFDKVAKRQGLSRSMAIEWLMRYAIAEDNVPAYRVEAEEKIQAAAASLTVGKEVIPNSGAKVLYRPKGPKE